MCGGAAAVDMELSQVRLYNGDSLEVLGELADNSIDSVVTDPPYGLSFMGKKWDYDVPSVKLWTEVYRVLKPGGHLLSFGGTRTYHRMVVNIEDAGFEIRDQIMWLYGSGFPKSHNISKAIDKKFGAEREVIGVKTYADGSKPRQTSKYADTCYNASITEGKNNLTTAPSTDLAKQYDGYGTALKPANEPIVMARKPLSEKTIVDNVLKWGTGGINIDGCRVEGRPRTTHKDGSYRLDSTVNAPIKGYGSIKQDIPQGRFPANIILDEVAGELLDEQSGILRQCSTIGQVDNAGTNDLSFKIGGHKKGMKKPKGFKANTYAGASRFFYCAKASKRERGTDNAHPTVKPIKLMEYLVRLVTPDGGIVLDPFMGSGTTGIAAKNEGFGFVGIERELEYLEIASKRIG